MVGTSSLDLIVANPAQALEKIRVLAEQLGGYLQSSQLGGNQSSPDANVTIRVPAARIQEARAEIKKLAVRIEGEDTEARDVTKEYVDMAARLRNLRVEEEQYLSIMKRANTVKDTLEVSEKLSHVRGQIEQQQAEFEALSKQVETVAITVALHAEAEAQVFGLHWRPLYELKLAARDGLDGLASYIAAMVSFVFLLPTILLWLGTILLGAAFGWRLLRWAGRVFFRFPKSATAAQPGS
jgi:cell division protein FtsL